MIEYCGLTATGEYTHFKNQIKEEWNRFSIDNYLYCSFSSGTIVRYLCILSFSEASRTVSLCLILHWNKV